LERAQFVESKQLNDILHEIESLADADNLAAVLIHINDTYFIDERPDSGVPGMARIAGLVEVIRRLVHERLGENRTLLLHSGDYLSPSALSLKFRGQQMVDLLNVCGVNYATIGNHEFSVELPVDNDCALAQRWNGNDFEMRQFARSNSRQCM
jgi:2',3'-cyclic-nucleotide 2'-phosphodiesterase (5'-nucleotidase family)